MMTDSDAGPARPAPRGDGTGTGAGPAAGLLMILAAVTLGVASYLHRQGHIPLGFTEIRGESFYGASIPEAVIAFVLVIGAALYLAAAPAGRVSATRRRARRIALAATGFAIAGTVYGITVTIGRGQAPDIVYHSCLMAILLTAGTLLLRRRPAPRDPVPAGPASAGPAQADPAHPGSGHTVGT